MSVTTTRNVGGAMKSGVCLLLSALLFAGNVHALPKRDVSDPVLQEIIASFSSRMPRFIDKHGDEVYVTDELITRASLMYALYEYDKSLKFNRKDFVSKEDYDNLSARLALLERKGMSSSSVRGKLDIMEVINGLQPNMGILLDNSLGDSRVFMELKNEVETRAGSVGGASPSVRAEIEDLSRRMDIVERGLQNGGGTGANFGVADAALRQEVQEMRAKLDQMERNSLAGNTPAVTRDMKENLAQTTRVMADITRRLDAIESRTAALRADESGEVDTRMRDELARINKKIAAIERNVTDERDSSRSLDEAKKANAQTRNELARLNQRIDAIERGIDAEGGNAPDAGDVRQYASGLTKIALGLGMVAAFFIAR